MSNDEVAIVLDLARKRVKENKVTPYLIEVIENAIANSEGKTEERYELLKIWRSVRKENHNENS